MQDLVFTVLKLNHFDLHHILKRLIAVLIMKGVSNHGRDHDHDRGHDHDHDHDHGGGRDHVNDGGHDGGHFND